MKAIELFQVNIQRATELLDIHKKSFPRGRPASTGPAADLLRATIVFGLAALDAYVHKRIIEVVKKILQQKNKVPEKCVAFVVRSLKEKEDMGKYRAVLNLAVQKDPSAKILGLLESSLSIRTFQKPEQIKLAFEMMDIKDGWKQINKLVKLKRGRKKRGRSPDTMKFLLELANRRDAIVHKSDMYTSTKYHGKIKLISRRVVKESLHKLHRIILATDKISNYI